MNRRDFISAAGAAGAGAMAAGSSQSNAHAAGPQRQVFEWREYQFDTAEQRDGFNSYMRGAFIPALNRFGIEPAGVFYPEAGITPGYVLIPHPDMPSVNTLNARLMSDDEHLEKGAAFIDAPADAPAYARMQTSLFKAFEGMPHIETPVEALGKVIQLRIYESPSVKTGQKKIEMFNQGEIAIFRKCGLHPVFFGEALAGPNMPNLTYMLAFESHDERKANWDTFVNDPEWKALSSKPEYADDKILSNITNIFLKAAPCSQV